MGDKERGKDVSEGEQGRNRCKSGREEDRGEGARRGGRARAGSTGQRRGPPAPAGGVGASGGDRLGNAFKGIIPGGGRPELAVGVRAGTCAYKGGVDKVPRISVSEALR